MIESPLFWLLLNVLTIGVLAFFSMEEMACVSFNRVRLQFYISQGSKKAEKLNTLLQNPSSLFGTTLIGVNVATFVGSECARRFHEAIGLSPDLAPISQIFLVIVFGELAPMFAARRYSEHVAFLGVDLISLASKVLAPAIGLLSLISKLANHLFGGSELHPHLFLTQDELQKVIEEQEDERPRQESEDFNAITSNIFRLRGKVARSVMTPLSKSKTFASQLSIGQVRSLCQDNENYLIVHHKSPTNIIGIVFIKDILRAEDHKKLHEFCSPPWFTGHLTPLLQILKQFRRNSENIAIVLSETGRAIGFINFDDLLDEITGKTPGIGSQPHRTLIDRSFSGHMTLGDFERETGIVLEKGLADETLSDWLIRVLDHHPEAGESWVMPPYEFTVKETSLLDIKSIHVKTQVF